MIEGIGQYFIDNKYGHWVLITWILLTFILVEIRKLRITLENKKCS